MGDAPTPWQAALAAHADGRVAEALVRLRRFLADEPDHWPARLLLCRLLTDVGRYADAHAALDAVAIDPIAATEVGRALVVRAMAELYDRAGQLEAALRAYAQLRAHAPTDADGYVLAGALLARHGRLADAAAIYQAGVDTCAGRLEELWHNLGLVRRAREDLPGAAAAFAEAVARDPGYAAAVAALADARAALALVL